MTKTWDLIQSADASPAIKHESMVVVYASFLVDRGRTGDAWEVIRPGRLVAFDGGAESWFVAAKVALAVGDREATFRRVAALDAYEPG